MPPIGGNDHGLFSCGVARRTVKYDSAALGSQTPHLTTAFRPRDEGWRDMQVYETKAVWGSLSQDSLC
jgi:hypothetical protein